MIHYILVRIAQFLVFHVPLRFAYKLATTLADLQFLLSQKDRHLVISNTTRVRGKNDEETRRISREVFRNFGKYLVEFFRFSKMDESYVSNNVTIEGVENLRAALDNKRGAIAFSAHLGNWEWGGALVAKLGFNISAITLPHKDKKVNDLFNSQRNIGGMGQIPLGGAIRGSLKHLAKNHVLAILSDRDFSNNSVEVNFFGSPAYMPIGTGVLALKSNCALLPIFVPRCKGNTHKLIIGKPIDYELSGNKQADIKDIVQKVTTVIETYVRKYPDQWFMFADPWLKNPQDKL